MDKGICFAKLKKALEQGLVTQERIDDEVRRSLIMKAKLGLLDANSTLLPIQLKGFKRVALKAGEGKRIQGRSYSEKRP